METSEIGIIDRLEQIWPYFEQGASFLADLAAVALVYGLYLTFTQIRQSVRINNTASKRAAICLAADQCKMFGISVLERGVKLHKTLSDNKCDIRRKATISRENGKLEVKIKNFTEEEQKRLYLHINEAVLMLNEAEAFAIPFATNVADDGVGYIECGRAFVEFFEQNASLYVFTNRIDGYFKATQALYWRWRERLEHEDLAKKQDGLKAEVNALSARIDKSKLNPKKPFGVD